MTSLFDGLEEVINSTLPKAKKEIVSNDENIEIEIRFRSLTGRSGAGVDDRSSFRRALEYFVNYIKEPERRDHWSFYPTNGDPIEDVVKYYKDEIRSIQKKDIATDTYETTITYERKHTAYKEELTIWPAIFAVSGEKTNVSLTQGRSLTGAGSPPKERLRRSFLYSPFESGIGMLRVDFTISTTQDEYGVKKQDYEIEIEASTDVKFEEFEKTEDGYKYTQLHTAMSDIYMTIFGYLHNTPIMYSMPMYRSVLASINMAFNPKNSNDKQISSYFVNKPRTLTWYDFDRKAPFSLFPPEGSTDPRFAVTIKTDGTRTFVYYHFSGIYLFNLLGGSMIKIASESPRALEGCMLDCEVLNPVESGPNSLKKRTYDVWAFDCLFVNNFGKTGVEQVADCRKWTLLQRLAAMKYVCRTHNENNAKMSDAPIQLRLTAKEFIPFNDRNSFYEANRRAFVQNIVNGKELFKTDGLVFTDMGPYLRTELKSGCNCRLSDQRKTCSKCVDFNPSVNRKFKPVELLTTDFVIKMGDDKNMELHAKAGQRTVPFTGNKGIKVDPRQFKHEFYENGWNEVELDAIYEFQWDKTEHIWIPLRERPDRKDPNNIGTANENWSVIHDDIPKGVLVGKIRGRKALALMRRYQNDVKIITLTHAAERTLTKLKLTDETRRPRLFDIGSGYGGDVKKWKATGFEVYALEPDPERLDELETRAREQGVLNLVQTLQLKIQEHDKLRKQIGVTIKPVDVVTSFHSMTLVYDKASSVYDFIKSLKTVLKVGGLFSCMAMDGAAIHAYLGNNKQLTMNGIKIQRVKNDTRQIMVKMVTSDASLARGQLEYLVDFDHLISSLELEGFELTLDNHLNTASLLTDTELWWCQMTRMIEMRYVGAKELPKTKEKLAMLTDVLSGSMRSAQVELDQIVEVKSSQLKCCNPMQGEKFWLVGVLRGGSSFFHALLFCIDMQYRKSKTDVTFRFNRVLKLRLELAGIMTNQDVPLDVLRKEGTFSLESCKETMAEYTSSCGSFMVPFIERVLNVNVHVLSWVNDELVPVRDVKPTFKPEANNVILHCDSFGTFEPIGRSLAGQENLAAFVFATGDSVIQALMAFKQ